MTSRSTLFVRRFTVLDFARFDGHRAVGDSLYVHAEVEGQLDERGFVMDFSRVKRLLKATVDGVLDHRFALPASRVTESGPGMARCELPDGTDYEAPLEAFALCDAVDDDSLARYLEGKVMERMPESVHRVRIDLEEERALATGPSYRYTHGLKKHDGNCQRLVHGHRNSVEAFVDGAPHRDGAVHLAELFSNAHFVCVDDLDAPLDLGVHPHADALIRYRSSQGNFSARLKDRQLIVLAEEPTVENIAEFARTALAGRLGVERSRVGVRAYEGLHMGASSGPCGPWLERS